MFLRFPLFLCFTDASRLSWWTSISPLTFKEGICIVLSSRWTCVSSAFPQQTISWIPETTTQSSHITSIWISSIGCSEWFSLNCLESDFNFFVKDRTPSNCLAVRTVLSACFDHLKESLSYKDIQFLKTFCLPVNTSHLSAENLMNQCGQEGPVAGQNSRLPVNVRPTSFVSLYCWFW